MFRNNLYAECLLNSNQNVKLLSSLSSFCHMPFYGQFVPSPTSVNHHGRLNAALSETRDCHSLQRP